MLDSNTGKEKQGDSTNESYQRTREITEGFHKHNESKKFKRMKSS